MFAENAARIAGFAGALLGWRPDEFWRATPAELAGVVAALSPATEPAANAATLTRLKELFPDG
jgi:hypothetical protein